MNKRSGAPFGAAAPCRFVVERHLMHHSKNKNLVPRLVLRLIVVERQLLHNSNKLSKYIKIKKNKTVWFPVWCRDSLLWSGN